MSKSKRQSHANHPQPIGFEALEERLVFSTITVNSLLDNTTSNGVMTLREAVELIQHGGDANAALGHALTTGEQARIDTTDPFGTHDTILISDTLSGGSITLGSTLDITGSMLIDGTADGVIITGGLTQAGFRALTISNSADVTLNRLTVSNFSQIGGSFGNAFGGAIELSSGVLTVRNSTFTNNSAIGTGSGGGFGGAISAESGTILSVTNSTFTGNSATGGGGGGTGRGGAINSSTASTTLNFTTISGNNVSGVNALARGALLSSGGSITNSILGQTDNSVTDLNGSGITGSNNLIRNTALSGVGNLSTADPMLSALTNNGGPTFTMAPQASSPVIDAAGATGLTIDQRGQTRVRGAAADVGALELGTAPTITSTNSASFTAGAAGSFTITTTGSPAIGWAGALPTGLTFTDNGDGTATIAGTPIAGTGGTYILGIFAINGVAPTAHQTFTLTVDEAARSIVTTGGGGTGAITVLNPNGTVRFTIANPFPRALQPRRIAAGDVTGDGINDVIVAPGAGPIARVFVYDGSDGSELTQFNPFGNFRGGVYVATGDVNHDGVADIIVGAGGRPGARPTINVYSGDDFSLITSFVPFAAAGQVRVAAADLDGDGFAEVITTRGAGAKVRVFDGQDLASNTATLSSEFTAFRNFAGGCYITTGDVNNDGQNDIVVSQGTGARPLISVFNGGDKSLQTQIRTTAFNGTTIACHDLNGDGYDDILAVVKSGRHSAVQIFSGLNDSVLNTIDLGKVGRFFIA